MKRLILIILLATVELFLTARTRIVLAVDISQIPFGYHAAYTRFGTCEAGKLNYQGTVYSAYDYVRKHEDNLKWQSTRYSGGSGFSYDNIENAARGWDFLDLLFKKTATSIFANIECRNTSAEPLDQNKCNQYVESILKRYDGDCDVNDNGNCTDSICQHSLTQSTTDCLDTDKIAEQVSITYPKIEFFQIANEPHLSWYSYDWSANPSGYALHFVNTASKIRSLCPTCKIALGGIAGDFSYLRTVLQSIGSTNSNLLDIFDFHFFAVDTNFIELVNEKTRYENTLIQYGFNNKNIVVTELHSWLTEGTLEQKDNSQAKELPKLYVYGITHGIKSLFWSPFLIETNVFGDSFFHAGLIRPGKDGDTTTCTDNDRKPSYQSYKTMTTHLSGFNSFNILNDSDTNDTIFIFKFNFPSIFSKTVLVAWSEDEYAGRDIIITDYLPNATLGNITIQSALASQPTSPVSLSLHLTTEPIFIIQTILSTPTPTACPLPLPPSLNSPANGVDIDFIPKLHIDLIVDPISQQCGTNKAQYLISFTLRGNTYGSGWIDAGVNGLATWNTGPYNYPGTASWKAKSHYFDTPYNTFRESLDVDSETRTYNIVTPTSTPTTDPCHYAELGDLNCDGAINGEDLSILNSAWTTTGPVVIPPEARRSPDLNGDDKVDERDLTTIMRNWTQ